MRTSERWNLREWLSKIHLIVQSSTLLISILLLGFFIGMQHAFEADHLAAVSVLVSRKRTLGEMTRHGAIWGLGHTLALVVISALVLVSPWKLPLAFGPILELVVGLMLVTLGARLLYRLWRERVHIHLHRHANGEAHLHAHSHRDETRPHAESAHDHRHPVGSWNTLLVGLIHGTAGSAVLTVYIAANLESPFAGLVYVSLFGLGSILGMALLSAIIAWPLKTTATRLTWANRGLQVVIGLASIAIGLRLAILQSGELWF